ncbi:MAG TPA: DUF3618 domain-containing protein [Mycobacteriales bacterium]|jgi:hypothetical protein|nr:DUF3618 domain-containing protein [Mycobacteriales bacterium]
MAQDEPQDAPSEATGDDAAADEVEGAAPVEISADDGGDVAGRDPDAIAREIEQTRAELADTIDAIADRMSPKRAAARGADALKAQVSSARSKVTGDSATPASSASADEPSWPAASAGGANPVAAMAPKIAAVGAVLLLVVLWRRRRSR